MRFFSHSAFAMVLAVGSATFGQPPGDASGARGAPTQFGESVVADFVAGRPARAAVQPAAWAMTADEYAEDGNVNRAPDAFATPPQPEIRIDAISADWEPEPPATTERWLARELGPLNWNIQAGTVLFWRDNQAANAELLHPNWLEFPGHVGPKLSLSVSGSGPHGVEASWFWFAAQAEGWFRSTSTGFVITEYYSSLSSGEINYVYSWEELSLLAGFRLMRWSEHYEEFATGPGNILQMHTDNDLVGGQLGLRWRRDRRILFWEATGKVGVFGNLANQSQIRHRDIYYWPWSQAWPRGYSSDAAVMLDLNLTVGVHLSRAWSLRYGYNLLWLDQLALAPNQYRWNNAGQIQTDGSVLLNGIEAMLEARW